MNTGIDIRVIGPGGNWYVPVTGGRFFIKMKKGSDIPFSYTIHVFTITVMTQNETHPSGQ